MTACRKRVFAGGVRGVAAAGILVALQSAALGSVGDVLPDFVGSVWVYADLKLPFRTLLPGHYHMVNICPEFALREISTVAQG